MYIYSCSYIYICIDIYTHTYVFVCVHTYLSIQMYTCVNTYSLMLKSVYVHIYKYANMKMSRSSHIENVTAYMCVSEKVCI